MNPTTTKRKVLIVEDDLTIIDLLEIHLKDLGFTVEHTMNGREGLEKALQDNPDLLILDVMLPEMDGLEICKRIRQEDRKIPILMLTSRSEELDKVLGLELGADDYITKPFSIREFIARVKALFRRMEADTDSDVADGVAEILEYAALTIDLTKRKVILSGTTLDLTAKEFDLLALFARNPGRAYNRQQLLDQVWGYQFSGYDHTVNSHINRLRAKLETDPAEPFYIKTVWGVGYRFIDLDELES